ncbi:hypothetical protein PCANB_000099 [Pneumocystis canis]|nr:hypothetical protein PCK1_000161 [Pneumocystis canis]KAG5439817.1 hypothetical protein PCANB_000099 [Pneumocystis canis]
MNHHKKSLKQYGLQTNIKKEPYERLEPIYWMLYVVKWSSFRFLILPIIMLFVIIVRALVALGTYSGSSGDEKYGDFEAQRHWMEITLHLPIKEWYFYSEDWWGLDYPPLSAYLSYIFGRIGHFIDPLWFALDTSRGLQTENLKFYMRMTVIISDFIVYFPAVMRFVKYWKRLKGGNSLNSYSSITLILLQPALILIDHGHFQYNNVMLGFALLSITYFINDCIVFGCIFFVFSLCFKQMSLYYSPLIFFYLLGRCITPRLNIIRFILISITTISTFIIIFLPFFIFGGYDNIVQCIYRIFPFKRGLWEDKVANVWCALNIIIKLKQKYSTENLAKLSLIATSISILPSSMILFFKPKKELLLWGLTCCAFGFFLFSFQVHEKSILLPLMPATMLLVTPNRNTKAWIGWINIIAVFSLWPLLKRDGLLLQYSILLIYWLWLGGFIFHPLNKFEKLIHMGSYGLIIIIHALEVFINPPLYYPHLWILMNMMLSFVCFGIFWIWSFCKLWVKSGIWTMENKYAKS